MVCDHQEMPFILDGAMVSILPSLGGDRAFESTSKSQFLFAFWVLHDLSNSIAVTWLPIFNCTVLSSRPNDAMYSE